MHKEKRAGVVTLFLALYAFWLVLASRFTLAQLIVGVVIALIIVLYSFDLVFSRDEASSVTVKRLWHFFVLFLVFIREMVKANIAVVRIVLSPKMNLDPHFKRIRQPLKKDLNRTLYGNAITLTPGTLTVLMDEESLVVHGLRRDNVDAIEGGAIQKAFVKIEEGEQ